jgi:hypothetical protein
VLKREIGAFFRGAAGEWEIGHLAVVAGPTAVGKSWLIARLAEDDRLRERLGVGKDTPAFEAGGLLKLRSLGPIGRLVLHYDILRPYHKRFASYDVDPGASVLGCAEEITFLTLRTTPERLLAQLDRRIASRERPREERFRKLRRFYADDRFLAAWYDHWLSFVEGFNSVTVGSYFVDMHKDYLLTSVPPYRASDTTSTRRSPRSAFASVDAG